MTKRPSFQFYPGDWLRSTDLRSCSVMARGLWMDMICLMHDGTPYGYLKVGEKIIDAETLSRMVGIAKNETEILLKELKNTGVVEQDKSGCFYCRRLVKDEKLRKTRAKAGRLGGKQKSSKSLANTQAKPYQMVEDEDEDEKEDVLEKEREVLKFLNNTADRKFRLTESTKTLIGARLKDYSLDDMKRVIVNKHEQWRGTEQDKFLRPETLFNATKFDGYINEPDRPKTTGNTQVDAGLALAAKYESEGQ